MGATTQRDLDFSAVEIDYGPTTQRFHIGRASAAVPGLLRGLIELHAEAGVLPLSELVQPAVRFGRRGFVLGEAIQWVHRLLEPIVTLTPGVRQITCLGDALAPASTQLYNTDLADFLEALGHRPDDALRAFNDALLSSFGAAAGGLITPADLQHWTPAHREPLRVSALGHDILLNSPPSAGGGLIAAAVRVFDAMEVATQGWLEPAHVLAVASAISAMSEMRLSGYDEAVAAGRGLGTWLSDAAVAKAARASAASREERQLGHTTHISAADEHGLAVGLTTSNGEGSGHVLDGLGVHVNNFLGEEDINPAGFHQHAPGVRLSTMMAPTVVLRDRLPVLVLGSGGSNRIRSAVFQGLVNHLHSGQRLDLAVNAPRMHIEGDTLWFESDGLPQSSVDALTAGWPGSTTFEAKNMFFGGVHAVARPNGEWVGAGDRRRGGVAATNTD
jgi:gamma-glutamyltranspeptidase/glutathione hydrolase